MTAGFLLGPFTVSDINDFIDHFGSAPTFIRDRNPAKRDNAARERSRLAGDPTYLGKECERHAPYSRRYVKNNQCCRCVLAARARASRTRRNKI
jgi:hypothetical protein